MLKGCMPICRNAEGVHGKRKVGNPCFSRYSRFTTTDLDRNKDRFKNCKLCDLWKLQFSPRSNKAHVELRLLSWSEYQSLCSDFRNSWIPPQSSLLRYLNFTWCSVFPLTCCIHRFGRLVRHNNTSVFLVLNFVPAWMDAVENRSSAFWRPCWEVASNTISFAKAKYRFCSSQRWHPRPLCCDCLSLRFSNFHEPWPPSKFNWRILNILWHFGYAISR